MYQDCQSWIREPHYFAWFGITKVDISNAKIILKLKYYVLKLVVCTPIIDWTKLVLVDVIHIWAENQR